MADEQQQTTVTVSGGSNTDPPQVRIINARAGAWKMVLSQLAELVGMGCFTAGLLAGKLTSVEYGILATACLSGNIVSKAMGKGPGSTTALVMSAGPTVAKVFGAAGAAKHVLLVALVLLPMLSGCGLFGGGADAATIHAQADDARDEINGIATELNSAGPLIELYCASQRDQTLECATGRAGYRLASLSVDAARAAIQAYDDTGVSYEAVRRAGAQLEHDLNDVRRIVALAQKVIDDVATQTAARPVPADGSPPGQGSDRGSDVGADPPTAESPGRAGEPAPVTQAPGAP